MHRRLLVALAITAIGLAPAAAHAQLGTSVSLAGGISLPQADFGKGSESGYNVAVGLNVGVPMLPVGVRLEGAYNGYTDKGSTATTSGKTNIISGTVNGTFGLGLPYVIGGLGYYSIGGSDTFNGVTTTAKRVNKMGINGGVGFRFPLGVISTFAEARYHKLFVDNGSFAYVPITFGINF